MKKNLMLCAGFFASQTLTFTASPAHADGTAPDNDSDGLPVVAEWVGNSSATTSSGPAAKIPNHTPSITTAAAVEECWGHFGTVQETADGAQYSGYTQCNGPHDLTITVALYRWNADTASYQFLASVHNQRFAWYVNAISAEPCSSQLSTRYKMRAFPTMDGIQMAGYAGWSDPFTITCRVHW